jgi:pyruvate dehydrogenase E1 component alpha subunit
LVRGVTVDRYLANYMGRADGVTGGKDGNMHFGDRELGCVGMVSMLPDMALVANGMALAMKMRGEDRVAMTFFGEGSTANGQWHEAMNFAGIHCLPVVFMLENNRFAYSTPNELEFAVDPVERAHAYGFPGINVDGNDVEEVFEAACGAVERALVGDGPTLIECQTMRMNGHGAHDDMRYVPGELREEWERRDPIDSYRKRLAAEHGFSTAETESILASVADEVAACAERALSSPMPAAALAQEGVFAEAWEALGDGVAPWSRWTPANGNGNGRPV